jgi:tetratricopeptide (TPR) repeat protein
MTTHSLRQLFYLFIITCFFSCSTANYKEAMTRFNQEDYIQGYSKLKKSRKRIRQEDYFEVIKYLSLKDKLDFTSNLIRLDYLNAFLYYQRASIYKNLSFVKESLADLDRTIALNPSFCNAQAERLLLLKQNDYRDTVDVKKVYEKINCHMAVVDSLRLRGFYYFYSKNYEPALALFTKAIDLDPKYYNLHLSIGICLGKLKRYEEAIDHFNMQLELTPDQYTLYGLRAYGKTELKDYDGAIEDWQKEIAAKQGLKPEYREIAKVYKLKEDYKNALLCTEKYLKDFPANNEMWLDIGFYNKKLGNVEASLTAYKKALEGGLTPAKKTEVLKYLTSQFKKEKNISELIETMNALMPLENSADNKWDLAVFYSLDSNIEMSSQLRKRAMEEAGNDSIRLACLYFNSGSIYYSFKIYDSAKVHLIRSCAYNLSGERLWKLAGVYKNLGEYEQAAGTYLKTMPYYSGNRDRADLSFWKGVCEDKLGKHDAALNDYGNALGRDSSSALYLNNYAWVLSELDRNREALYYVNRSLAISSDYTDALDTKGSILFGLKEYKKAHALFDRCLELSPDYPNSHLYKGKLYLLENNLVKACESLQKAKSLGKKEAEILLSKNCEKQ